MPRRWTIVGDTGGLCNDARRAAGVASGVAGVTEPFVGDFNGDGRADILSYPRSRAFSTSLWYGTPTGFRAGPPIRVWGWYDVTIGDFNGDGRDDILWTGNNGSSVWYGNATGAPFTRATARGFAGTPVAAHFTNSRYDDTLNFENFPISHTSGLATPTSLGQANGFASGPTLTLPPIEVLADNLCTYFEALIIGDFNGDGRDDVLLYRSDRLSDHLWYSTGHSFTNGPAVAIYGNYWPVIGDFNGDGRADILWYGISYPHNIPSQIWYGTPTGFRHQTVNIDGRYQPIVGDFNGDGHDDIYWYGARYGSSSGPSYVWYGTNNGFRNGAPTHVYGSYESADAADFNGDGRSDIYWLATFFNTQPRTNHLWHGTPTGFTDAGPVP